MCDGVALAGGQAGDRDYAKVSWLLLSSLSLPLYLANDDERRNNNEDDVDGYPEGESGVRFGARARMHSANR